MTQATCKRHIQRLGTDAAIVKGFLARAARIGRDMINEGRDHHTDYDKMILEAEDVFWKKLKKKFDNQK